MGGGAGGGAEDTPTSLYIPSSYITNKLSEVASSGSALTCVTVKMDTSNTETEMPLDMSKTSSIYQKKKESASSYGSLHQPNPASHRDLFPGLYLLVDTALGVHDRLRPVHVAPMKG